MPEASDIFAYLEEFLIIEFPYYYMLLFGIILIIVILFLPNGLVGLIQRGRRGKAAECKYLKVKQEITTSKKVIEVYLRG